MALRGSRARQSTGSAASRTPRRSTPRQSEFKETRKRTRTSDEQPALKRARRVPKEEEEQQESEQATLNSPPQPIAPVHESDIQAGRAVRISLGELPGSTDGAILARKLFVWGTGEAGQLSLGGPDDDNITKLTKPKPFGNKSVSMQIDNGEFGVGGCELIAAGGMHTLVIDGNGRILSCGSEDHGTLGRLHRTTDETEDEDYYVLRPVEDMSPVGQGVSASGETGKVNVFRATRTAASDGCTVALDAEGRLVCWGHFKDAEGKVCFSDTDENDAPREQWSPVSIEGLKDERFAQVACGENHVLALTLDGRVYTWGLNSVSQLGRFANVYHVRHRFMKRDPPASTHLTPVVVAELKNIVRIGSGLNASFAVDRDGHVYAWGLNTRGQTGVGSKKECVTRPTRVRALEPAQLGGARVVQISGGEFHTAFLLSNGQVYICGDGDEGKLGLPKDHPALAGAGSPPELRVPVHVPFPAAPEYAPASATNGGNTAIAAIAAGMRFTFALAADGTLYSWGTTSDEAMGQPAGEWGADQSKETPTIVPMPGEPGSWSVVNVATAGQHSLALAVRKP